MTPTSDSRKPYLVVADRLRERIAAGEFAAGERLPAWREFGTQYRVSPNTVERAVRVLQTEGLLVTEQGRGTFVRDGASEALQAAGSPEFRELSAKLDDVVQALQDLGGRVGELERIAQPSRDKRSRG